MIKNIKKFGPLLFICAAFLFPKITFAADWTNIGFADQSIKTTFVDPKNNQHIIISLNTYIDHNYDFYTDNGGTTWQPVNLGGAMAACNNFVSNPKNNSEIWAGCTPGLFHSIDGGKNFSPVDKFRYYSNVNVDVTTDGVIYVASTGNSVYKSVDGLSWDLLRIPGVSNLPIIYLDQYTANEIYLFQPGSGLYLSTDYGTTWGLITSQTPIRNGLNQLVFQKSGKICASVGTVGIACSDNGGFTWGNFVSPNPLKPSEYNHFYHLIQNPDDDTNLLVLAGNINGTDTKIYSYKADTTIPEVTAMAQSFNSISISQGVVFAWSSDYGSPIGLWRNDGIAVVPEYLKKHPVIIVPGILGSWYWPLTNKWELDPLQHTYTELYNNFIMAGYEPGKTLFDFPYQWRADNQETAYLLKQKIDEAKVASGANKVDIVAHSMGGIVTRIYAQSDVYQNDINRIIFLGTPQTGSISSYPMWEAGNLSLIDENLREYMKILLKEESLQHGYVTDGILKYVRNDVPSIAQLLPTNSYLNGKTYPNGYPRNTLLEALEINKAILSERGIKVTNIVGEAVDTPDNIDVLNGDFGIYWPDGKALNYYSSSGDGTVSLQSQLDVPGDAVFKAGVKHVDLPKMSINDVFKALGINYSTTDTVNVINKYLYIAAYSPVDFYVIAPDGKKIGFNKDGASFDEISGAFYTGNTTETEFLTIPNPTDGEYKVVTYGTGSGSYEIEATYADDETNKTISSSYYGSATPGKEDNLLVKFSPDTNVIETKIDDKIAPVTTATVSGTKINEYYVTDVKIEIAASDLESGVSRTEYSSDGAAWQDYDAPIILSNDGELNIFYRSVDKAGNVENVQKQTFKIDKTPPNVVVTLNKTNVTRWDKLDLICSVTDNYSGMQEFTVSLDGKTIVCGGSISMFNQSTGLHKIQYFAKDKAGNSTSGGISFNVVVTYDSIIRDICWLNDNKNFKDWGDAMSLITHVELSGFYNLLGQDAMSTKSLAQAQFLLDKQMTKNKVSGAGYDMITKDIKYILEGK